MDVPWIEQHGMVCHGTDFLGLSPDTVSTRHKEKIIREERKNNSTGEINESYGKAHESGRLQEKVREAWVISLRSQHILAVQLPFGHPLFPAFNPGL